MKFVPAKTPKLLKLLFPQYIWSLPASKSEKVIYLTFDDGPIPEVTEFVLKQLQYYNAKATFFCIGDNINKYPYLFQKLIEEGHSIGNHTYNHLKAWKTTSELYLKNVQKCEEEMQLYLETNNKKKLFRPPYGQISRSKFKILIKEGYTVILWDILAKDWVQQSPYTDYCYTNIVDNAKNGSIIVFHDSIKAEKNLRKTLPKVLEHFSARGFEFKKITF